jgi:hypothetical protein
MLMTSIINPKLSAATHILGQYDFNRTLMAPPGTRIIAHEAPSRRQTWAPHGQDGWHIEPALEHYRCYTVYITKTWGERIVETVDFSPEEFTLPFPSPKDLATQAAVELTHALLHPQHADPFCQLGDAQTIDLKRLADIFEGATRRKTKLVVPPTEKEDDNAPLRVQNAVSPTRVPNTTTQQMSPQHKITTHSTQNSHRRQKRPAIRAVTPQTPKLMVRWSAGQKYNLSQDMMDETISQANHCFTILKHLTHQKTKINIGSRDISIMPEMANAVICPETGESLKHHELITKLKHKIKWMRSTAN